MTELDKQLRSQDTAIPGLTVWELPVHGDSRGWFKENWQREKMVAAGLPDFGPVQNNISFNDAAGTTRGVHAEPWDKWVSIASGRIFGAWVDLRKGDTFGTVVTAEIDASRAVFVPRGVGNAYQSLEPNTAYSYLVNDHWSPDAEYTFLNLADETAAIPWPISLDRALVSDKDLAHPRLAHVTPVEPLRTVVLGGTGQVGKALRAVLPDADFPGRDVLDLADPVSLDAFPWREYQTVINAAAYTNVDGAETPEGRIRAWQVNAAGPAHLARIATEHRLTLVHLSSDYVFDGTLERPYLETDPLCPLGVYGQTKAAGDLAVQTTPRHYIVRTSWVIGEGKNFVRTMASLAERGVDPRVVDDQIGRLTFAADLATAIRHLLNTDAPYGVFNVSGGGEPASWYEVSRQVFRLVGADANRVTPVGTAEYLAGTPASGAAGSHPVLAAPRPCNSHLDLANATAAGLVTPDWCDNLAHYIECL